MKLLKTAIVAVALALVALPSLAENVWREGAFRGTVILTVTGNVELPTRGASTGEVDKFFTFNDLAFDKAAQFDGAALLALPQVAVRADFPMGGTVYTYEGPLLEDVLRAAGATGETVTIRALDGYAVEIPLAEAIAKGAVVALKRDDIPFAIGDYGPTHVIFPRAERVDLANMVDDWWIWSIYHIEVN